MASPIRPLPLAAGSIPVTSLRCSAHPRGSWWCLFLIAALALAAGSARADIRTDPVKVHLAGPPRFAVAGAPFSATIEVAAARRVRIGALTASGPGWQVTAWDAPPELELDTGSTRQLSLTAVPAAGFGPLVLRAEVDGRPWRQLLDLSPDAYQGRVATDSPLLPPRRVLAAGSTALPAEPELSYAALSLVGSDDPSGGTQKEPIRDGLTMHGKIRYWHEVSNQWVPAYGAKVMIVAWAPGPPTTWGPVHTSMDGSYSIEIPLGTTHYWVWFQASNWAAVLEDPVWEDDWNWSTGIFELPPGVTDYDAGWSWPESHRGALHLMSDLTFGHDMMAEAGYGLDHVDVQWPEDDDGAPGWYNPLYNEVHITRGRTWYDDTAGHEYGHYWNDIYGYDPIIFDYCNGICDDGECSHCPWCPEEPRVTWIEGVAHLISRLVTEYIDPRTTFDVVHRAIDTLPADVNNISECPGTPWDPWFTEFVFAAAMFDMVDDDRFIEADLGNTDVFGDPVTDDLDLDAADILRIITQSCEAEGHSPRRAWEFFRCAAEYLSELGSPDATLHDLWETAWNCDLPIDEEVPGVITNLTSTIPVGVPTSTNYVTFNWTAAPDDLSGVAGYSVSLDGSPGPPNDSIDTRDTHYSVGPLAAGTYYFNVRSADWSGKESPSTVSLGPIIISAPGQADLAPQTPSGWSAPLVVRSTTVAEPNPVTQPSTIQGSTVYFNWGERNAGTGPTGNFRDVIWVDDQSWYNSAIHYLGAGQATTFRNQGPHDTGLTGRHTLWVHADGQFNVAEPVETDNIYARQFVFTPQELSPDEMVTRSAILPDPLAGATHISGVPFYPNCDGYDVELAVFPELVWAGAQDIYDHVVLRMHERLIGQTGFADLLHQSPSGVEVPASVILSPAETGMVSYCLGVSGQHGGEYGYRIRREQTRNFSLPDSVTGTLAGYDCLEVHGLTNSLDEDAWFTLVLANRSSVTQWFRVFHPGFSICDLFDADTTLTVAPGDTVRHSLYLATDEMALAVVGKSARDSGDRLYALQAHRARPDLEAHRPSGWFANLVPQIGLPYDPNADPIPAPASLEGGTQTTGIYNAFRNASPESGAPAGARFRVDLDGVNLFDMAFIQPLSPGQEVRLARSTLYTVRGGRHTLAHRLNASHAITEDDYGNNNHGRQWVWSPASLALSELHTLPAPPDPFGGVTYVSEGTVAPNCDGYRCQVTVLHGIPTLVTAACADDALDVDLGLYASAGVQDGFTTAHAQSQVSGAATDFVLRYLTANGTYSQYLGAIRASGPANGDYRLCAQTHTLAWGTPVIGARIGTIEAGTFVDALLLSLPAGAYRVTLHSADAALGVSLHDVSDGYDARSTPWQNGQVFQLPDEVGQVKSFHLEAPDPHTTLAVMVWRAGSESLGIEADWRVTISAEESAVPPGALPAAARLLAAAPNPFFPGTEIAWETPGGIAVRLDIYDVSGRLMRGLFQGVKPAGRHTVAWNGRANDGRRAPAGVYLARLTAPGVPPDLIKLTLLR